MAESLSQFLLDRIAEDEQLIADLDWPAITVNPLAAKRRLLAECAAKRRIIAMAQGSDDFYEPLPTRTPTGAHLWRPYHSPSVDILIRIQQLLALSYVDHPAFQPEWKVE